MLTGYGLAILSVIFARVAKRRGDVPGADGNAYFQVIGLFLNVVAIAVVPRLSGEEPDISPASLVVSAIGLLMAAYGFWGAFVRPGTALAAKTRECHEQRAAKELLQRKWTRTRSAARAVKRRREEIADPANHGRIPELERALKMDLKKLANEVANADNLT